MQGKTRQECRAEGCAKLPFAIFCILWFFLYLFIFLSASVLFTWSWVMHGCKRCPIEPIIHPLDAYKNIDMELPSTYQFCSSGDQRDHRERLGEGAAGSVLCREGFESTKCQLGHDSRDFPTSSNFMQFQFGTGQDKWNSKFEVCINFLFWFSRLAYIGSVPVVCKWLVAPSLVGVTFW